jgi:hypothetical protein
MDMRQSGKNEKCVQNLVVRGNLGNQCLDVRIILKMLERYGMRIGIGLNWLMYNLMKLQVP